MNEEETTCDLCGCTLEPLESIRVATRVEKVRIAKSMTTLSASLRLHRAAMKKRKTMDVCEGCLETAIDHGYEETGE